MQSQIDWLKLQIAEMKAQQEETRQETRKSTDEIRAEMVLMGKQQEANLEKVMQEQSDNFSNLAALLHRDFHTRDREKAKEEKKKAQEQEERAHRDFKIYELFEQFKDKLDKVDERTKPADFRSKKRDATDALQYLIASMDAKTTTDESCTRNVTQFESNNFGQDEEECAAEARAARAITAESQKGKNQPPRRRTTRQVVFL